MIPVELMLVSDFSGSMNSYLQDKNGRSLGKAKITILREVVSEISKILLPEDVSEGVSPFNRVGFTTFSGGVQQRDVTEGCVFPYEGKVSTTPQYFSIPYWITGNNTPLTRGNNGRWKEVRFALKTIIRGIMSDLIVRVVEVQEITQNARFMHILKKLWIMH